MAYGAALERRFTRKGIEGSNPSPSANKKLPATCPLLEVFYLVRWQGFERECRGHSPHLARDMPAACLRVGLAKVSFFCGPRRIPLPTLQLT